VLDIATGGGDLPLDLARRARNAGVDIEVAGCDISLRAIAYARLRARALRCRARFFQLDVLASPLPMSYDVITCGLFLHHLSRGQASLLLRKLAESTKRMLLVDDLRRSRRGFWLAGLATHALSCSPIVRADGLRSVRAAFTVEELRDLAKDAGLQNVTLETRWPERQLLVWRRT
jgi:2-polyprenyl-3-methyl-5-hydroxy-6-metoxy-1,4-benzoquinol methylase